MKKIKSSFLFAFIFSFLATFPVYAQSNQTDSEIKTIHIYTPSGNNYFIYRYKDTKPDDVPQEVYDALWEIQKEVVDNFTYSYTRSNSLNTLEDYYKYGQGVCEDYTGFFILLLKERGLIEKGLTKNLYKVSGKKRGASGHAWFEYRTENNVYIIDPTWSDDYTMSHEQMRQQLRESPAYVNKSFFITYEEDKIIFRGTGHNHSSFYDKVYTPLWEAKEQ